MRLNKLFIIGVLAGTFLVSCKKDDNNDVETVPPRDQGEQSIDDDEAILAYLQTHFYNAEDFENPAANFNYVVNFDTITGDNAGKTPIMDSDLLTSKIVRRDSVDYTIYILKIREGAGDKPTFADSTYQNYKGELLNQDLFDNTANPVWFDFPGIISTNSQGQPIRTNYVAALGFIDGLVEFREASGYEVNPDNTIKWNNDYGIGAVFMPSGLGYFANPPLSGSIPSYSPLIFSFQLYLVNQADHDQDGIPSYLEDLNNDKDLFNDDTDSDNFPNYLDTDDDGDGTLTRDEIIINEDGTVSFPDSNGDGVPDYLDEETF